MAHVLVVEDDSAIRAALVRSLTGAGHAVTSQTSGMAGLSAAVDGRPDVVVLDLGLPDVDGLVVLSMLRAVSMVPVVVATARDDEKEIIRALDAGADDYLVKPFGAGELLARVRAQLRRQSLTSSSADTVLRFGTVTVDLVRRVVERNGAPLRLTPIEYRLLTHLASQPDRVIVHRQLLKAVWGPGHAEDTHYVRVHMANLRKKVEDDPARPRHLLTEAGIGYRFRL